MSSPRASPSLQLAPSTLTDAVAFVRANHRHAPFLKRGLFAVALEQAGARVGVGIAGRPVSIALARDPHRIELARVCTLETPNGCSMLYGALCRAARALGYRLAHTYTREEESGASLRAAGFTRVAWVCARDWNRPRRPRASGLELEPRWRWERAL